jgi:hypothetical protein
MANVGRRLRLTGSPPVSSSSTSTTKSRPEYPWVSLTEACKPHLCEALRKPSLGAPCSTTLLGSIAFVETSLAPPRRCCRRGSPPPSPLLTDRPTCRTARTCLEKLSEKSRRCLRRSPPGRQKGTFLRIPAKATLGALLAPLFGQFLRDCMKKGRGVVFRYSSRYEKALPNRSL